MSSNLATILTASAERDGDRTALKLDDTEVSYGMLDAGSQRVAGLLKSKGLQPGDRVGVMLPNVPYFAAVYYGILFAGGVVVPMNVLLKGREVAYLLQRMEAYPGAVILATNFKRNIDDAFMRRLDFVVDFPFPEADDRKQIWRLVLPAEAPVAADVDLDFLATQFKLSGGAIRNCSLAAAFQAADDDGVIGMRHLVRAVALEYGKQGRLTLEADFERFHELIRTPGGGTPRNGAGE